MDPLEQLQMVRQELQRMAADKLASNAAPAEMQAKLSQLHTALSGAEEHLRATLSRARPTKAEIRADGDKLVAEKMRRVEEIKALKQEHGAAWVFVPTAAERAAAAVPPIAAAEVPGLIHSMFEQLQIRPGAEPESEPVADREIWEDLSQMEGDRSDASSITPVASPNQQAGKKPQKPAAKGDSDIWEDLSQMDDR